MPIFITLTFHRINLRNKELKKAHKHDIPSRLLGCLIVISHNNKHARRKL